ncbi:hypothetical protein BY996DRAFT_6870588 [Phakopsora pachyrhizi]|uniref:Expressed protein n=1 Tax=Phakopsora pachyrhizi TaxID=170000 RepID=A0AAV0BMP4_PHAPC|nr:hypothetical protein BY996DRAFT_6870588 [Phakopsora pachyrhizi]CAH7687914.1 expressed protein [Phakopsora pachyrhizi]
MRSLMKRITLLIFLNILISPSNCALSEPLEDIDENRNDDLNNDQKHEESFKLFKAFKPKYYPVDIRSSFLIQRQQQQENLMPYRAYDDKNLISNVSLRNELHENLKFYDSDRKSTLIKREARQSGHYNKDYDRKIEPRQAVVIASTSYPGTDTIFATKTVFLGPQQQPTTINSNNQGLVAVLVDNNNQPIYHQPTPQVIQAGRTAPIISTLSNPNIAVVTVTVYSSARKDKTIMEEHLFKIVFLSVSNLINLLFVILGFKLI